MLINHLILALRQLIASPILATMKIVGLGLGIGASLLLIKFASWHWRFDKFHENRDRIVRVETNILQSGAPEVRNAMTYSGVAPLVKSAFPEVVNSCRLGKWIANDVLFRHEENLLRGTHCYFADPSFFDTFSFTMIAGNGKSALSEPNTVVLTETAARKLFGTENPLDRSILFENRKPFRVTGIVADPPPQSHIQFEILASYSTMTSWGLEVFGDDEFDSPYVYTYLLLAEGSDLDALSAKITSEVSGSSYQNTNIFRLQPLEEIHLYSNLSNELGPTGLGKNILTLISIAFVVLILGWINHFNIATAQALDNIKSLSIRKIIGASRKDLFLQLFIAALLTNILGICLGVVIVAVTQPQLEAFFSVTFDELSIDQVSLVDPVVFLGTLLLSGTLLSAIFLASLLSQGQIVEHVYGTGRSGIQKSRLRGTLIVLQFAAIMVLMVGSGVIYQQVQFMLEKNLGFQTKDILVLRGPLGIGYEKLHLGWTNFKHEIQAIPNIESITASHDIPGNSLELIEKLNLGNQSFEYGFYRNYGDPGYFETLAIPFIAKAANFSKLKPDERGVVVNRMAADFLGFKHPEDAIGQELELWDWELQITGVVDNYHQLSLHHAMIPVIYDYRSGTEIEDGYYTIRAKPGTDLSDLTSLVEPHFKEAFPYTVFEPISLEDHYFSQYRADRDFKWLAITLTGLAIFIGCLGLLGLLMISISQRIKEIGIRKILGASNMRILNLLSKRLLQQVAFAIVMAMPISFYLAESWLQRFNYRIEISGWVFILAIGLTFGLSLLTIAIQYHRLTTLKPIEHLRVE